MSNNGQLATPPRMVTVSLDLARIMTETIILIERFFEATHEKDIRSVIKCQIGLMEAVQKSQAHNDEIHTLSHRLFPEHHEHLITAGCEHPPPMRDPMERFLQAARRLYRAADEVSNENLALGTPALSELDKASRFLETVIVETAEALKSET